MSKNEEDPRDGSGLHEDPAKEEHDRIEEIERDLRGRLPEPPFPEEPAYTYDLRGYRRTITPDGARGLLGMPAARTWESGEVLEAHVETYYEHLLQDDVYPRNLDDVT